MLPAGNALWPAGTVSAGTLSTPFALLMADHRNEFKSTILEMYERGDLDSYGDLGLSVM